MKESYFIYVYGNENPIALTEKGYAEMIERGINEEWEKQTDLAQGFATKTEFEKHYLENDVNTTFDYVEVTLKQKPYSDGPRYFMALAEGLNGKQFHIRWRLAENQLDMNEGEECDWDFPSKVY